jgi:hypothetical protein
MPVFKPMKREDVLKALEGQKDILEPIFKQNEEFFKRLSCPACKGEVSPIVDSRRPYREGSVLPNFLAKCKACGIEFEPHTGIQVTMATP